MPLVDDRGRLFGRVNLVDALLLVVLLGLVPLSYGAYALFRTPAPRLTSIEPSALVNGGNLRVSIRGEHFRPYMRVSFGNVQGNTFIFRSTSEALVDLNPMAPGVYDVVLFDNAQERARLPSAFTLTPTPLPASQVMLVGSLGNLTAEKAAAITSGTVLEGIGEIVEVAAPLPETTRVFAGPVLEIPIASAVRLPVVIRAACTVQAPQGIPQCTVGDAALRPTSLILVKLPGATLPFQIDQLRGLQPLEPARVTVQVIARREIVSQLQPGDIDLGSFMNPLAAGAKVVDVGRPLNVGGDTERVDVALSVVAQRTSSNWTYAAADLRSGSPMTLRTPRYEVQGTVLTVEPEWSPPGQDQGSR